MRFNAALARRVALILGLSFPTFCNALADGRAVLPPRWMVEAYLSDALVKPSRDDIARAIVPGLGMVPAFMGGGFSYADAIAAITNKSIYLRGDSFTGSDGATITGGANAWTNEGSSGGTFVRSGSGNYVWENNSQNGMPGVKLSSAAASHLTQATDYNTLHGVKGAMTVFAVERRSGTQGTATDDSLYTNAGGILGDISGYAGYYYSTRNIWYYRYTSQNQDSGLAFADSVPFVVGMRINTSGNFRINFNNESVYSDLASRDAPSSSSSDIFVAKTNSTTTRGYEYIVTADVLADELIDKIVGALKQKWGIT